MGSIADPAFLRSLVDPDVTLVYHLAAVLSGQSEEDFDAGMRVNVDGTRSLLEACRALGRSPRFVFSSTIAVFGGDLPPVVPEDLALHAADVLRRRRRRSRSSWSPSTRGAASWTASPCRLATITVRPGEPNSALSAFVSGIIREPLAGIDTSCPVPLDTPIWISSPGAVTENLVHAASHRHGRARRAAVAEPAGPSRHGGRDARQPGTRRRSRGPRARARRAGRARRPRDDRLARRARRPPRARRSDSSPTPTSTRSSRQYVQEQAGAGSREAGMAGRRALGPPIAVPAAIERLRHRQADVNTASIASPVSSESRSSVSVRDQRVERRRAGRPRWSRRCPSRCRAGWRRGGSCPPGPGRPARGRRRRPSFPTTCISALAVSCGRWLTAPTNRSWSSGVMMCGTAPRPATNCSSRSIASAAVARRGVRIHGRPSNRSGAWRCAAPPRAAPAIGWPPMNEVERQRARAAATDRRAWCCQCR